MNVANVANFAILQQGIQAGIDHLGIQVETDQQISPANATPCCTSAVATIPLRIHP